MQESVSYSVFSAECYFDVGSSEDVCDKRRLFPYVHKCGPFFFLGGLVLPVFLVLGWVIFVGGLGMSCYTKQPEDGLKWAETCSCGIYVHFVHKLCSVLTANYKLLLIHRTQGDVILKS